MALFDENGNEVVGAMTKEEIDAAVKKAAEDAVAAAQKAADDQKVADEKKAADDAAAKAAAEAGSQPDPIKEAQARLDRIERAAILDRYVGQDAEKRTALSSALDKLPASAYTSDDAGFASRIADAQRLAGIAAGDGIGIPDGTGGGRNVDKAPATLDKPEDKMIQKALNISEADVKQFGPTAAAASEANK